MPSFIRSSPERAQSRNSSFPSPFLRPKTSASLSAPLSIIIGDACLSLPDCPHHRSIEGRVKSLTLGCVNLNASHSAKPGYFYSFNFRGTLWVYDTLIPVIQIRLGLMDKCSKAEMDIFPLLLRVRLKANHVAYTMRQPNLKLEKLIWDLWTIWLSSLAVVTDWWLHFLWYLRRSYTGK